jgi:hypothetical protein
MGRSKQRTWIISGVIFACFPLDAAAWSCACSWDWSCACICCCSARCWGLVGFAAAAAAGVVTPAEAAAGGCATAGANDAAGVIDNDDGGEGDAGDPMIGFGTG